MPASAAAALSPPWRRILGLSLTEAIERVRTALRALPLGPERAAATSALRLLVDEPDVDEGRIEQAHDDLITVLPELRTAVDRIIVDRRLSSAKSWD